jgi:hypothetical protein
LIEEDGSIYRDFGDVVAEHSEEFVERRLLFLEEVALVENLLGELFEGNVGLAFFWERPYEIDIIPVGFLNVKE